MNFYCDKCGCCCRRISGIEELKEYDAGDGVCINLINNACVIYDQRPDICNIEKMFESKYKKYFTREEFYIMNKNACMQLKEMEKNE